MSFEHTLQKARQINSVARIYGTFAEIGAGQEVARFFFQAGQASKTIAKTISAYDMIYSDEIYGKEKSGRYVCESRVLKMLDKEYSLLHRRLDEARGESTTFFAFANTVATGDGIKKYSHGWMGVRFQTKAKGPANDIILHVRLLDRVRLHQQETLGVLGVNLVHAAFMQSANPQSFITSLVQDLKPGQVAIDFIRVTGPDMAHFNNHLLNLELVRRNLTEAILFGPDGEILNISDELYQKPLLIQRGTFKPPTNTHIDVLEKGCNQFKADFKKDPMVLFELTMNSMTEAAPPEEQDALDRVKALCSLKRHVLVSNFRLFYRLKKFLRSFTQEPVIMILGASHLHRLFSREHYADLEGGLLEGMGRLLDEKTGLFVYPHKTVESCMTTKSFFPEPELLKIYQYFIERKQIKDISGCDETGEYLHSADVQKMILEKNPRWRECVPASVRTLIEKEKLFNFL